MWEYTPTEELYHHGVKGMKWGHRKADHIRNRSSAYDSTKGKWIREPDGGSLKRQEDVMNAKNRFMLARGRADKKAAKQNLKKAKEELDYGYEEYKTFMKDMRRQYGKANQYVYDPDKKQYVNKRTRKSIKDYEYTGMAQLKQYKELKGLMNRAKISKGIAWTTLIMSSTAGLATVIVKSKK